MAAEIIKVYRQEWPALRFIGVKYGDADRRNGSFSHLWEDWMGNSRFDALWKLIPEDAGPLPEDGDALIGLMRWKEGEPFEYWIGIFTPENTPVPPAYQYHDFGKAALGVAWVRGRGDGIFMQEETCAERLIEAGFRLLPGPDGASWFFERYAEPRFTRPDAEGNAVLDICYFVE